MCTSWSSIYFQRSFDNHDVVQKGRWIKNSDHGALFFNRRLVSVHTATRPERATCQCSCVCVHVNQCDTVGLGMCGDHLSSAFYKTHRHTTNLPNLSDENTLWPHCVSQQCHLQKHPKAWTWSAFTGGRHNKESSLWKTRNNYCRLGLVSRGFVGWPLCIVFLRTELNLWSTWLVLCK